AFPYCHCSKSAVSGMTVRSQDHLTASGKHFSRILVDDSLMRRYIDAAVFFGTGQSKHMVILIDRAAYSTAAVVAVGKHVRNREPLKSGRSCCLDDSDKRNVM